MVTVRKVKKLAIHASLDQEIVTAIDEIAALRCWSRAQAVRYMLSGLVRSLKKSGRDKDTWYSFNDLEITVKSNMFEKMK